jgi:RNA polymerase sigma-70 factor (ECF subfamily)
MKGKEIKETVKAASQGNVDAFAELFEELRPMVYTVAVRYVGPNDANDVVMNTYLKAWQAIPKFKFRSSLKTWLYRIAYNCTLDHLKGTNRRDQRFVTGLDEEKPILDKMPDPKAENPETLISRKDNIELVRSCLEELSEEYRITLLLRYSDDMNYTEIAAATGVKVGTVMSRLFNGKKKLKAILKKYKTME